MVTRVGYVYIDRGRGTAQCYLSEVPDPAWRRAVEDPDQLAPFFARISLDKTVLVCVLAHTTQRAEDIIRAIDRRIESANARAGRG